MNQKEMRELIEFLVEKDIAEFEMERGDLKLHIKRGAAAAAPPIRARARDCPSSAGDAGASDCALGTTLQPSRASCSRQHRPSQRQPRKTPICTS